MRRSFLNKIHKMLKERRLPIRFACAFPLTMMDGIEDLQCHVGFPWIVNDCFLLKNFYLVSDWIFFCLYALNKGKSRVPTLT